MCYNAGIELINPLGAAFPPAPFVNAAARPVAPVLTCAEPEQFRPMRWLLVPPGITRTEDVKGLKIWLANARIEELEQKPLYRPLLKDHRCLVRFSWFFEWRWENPRGSTKTRYRVLLPGPEPMLLPGVYRETEIDDRPCGTFTVCTMEARGVMRYIHNHALRQPVVVDEKAAAVWLDRTVPLDEARRAVIDGERSAEFTTDPPLQRDLFGDVT